MGLWKTTGASSTNQPSTYCNVHNAQNTGSTSHANNEPVITLNGEAHITINVGETYTELGATAKDA